MPEKRTIIAPDKFDQYRTWVQEGNLTVVRKSEIERRKGGYVRRYKALDVRLEPDAQKKDQLIFDLEQGLPGVDQIRREPIKNLFRADATSKNVIPQRYRIKK